MGEEWRRGWHPERIAPRRSQDSVLVIGAGPAGLECARALGARGYDVHLAEATDVLGGHVTSVASLPGLGAWTRVRDYRTHQIGKLANVQVYRNSRLTAEDVRSFGFAHVAVATGSTWRRDGVGRRNPYSLPGLDAANVLTPDDLLTGTAATSPVVLFDDEHYYMAGCLAERLRRQGHDVTLVTPAAEACTWARWTDEQHFVEPHLLKLGVKIVPNHNLAGAEGDKVQLASTLTGERWQLRCATLVLITSRNPCDGLYHDLMAAPDLLRDAGIKSVARIGDCLAPGLIVDAVYSGHCYARALDEPPPDDVAYKRERPTIEQMARST
jgi:dimethylamine/trimethylamine dehydrogenase